MAQSQLALYNLAVAIVGGDYTIAATGESSIPAATCELFYENVRQVTLRAAHWNSAKRFGRLVREAFRDDAEDWVTTDPEPGYAFSYDWPSGMLAARYMTDFQEFALAYDDNGKTIVCNTGSTAAVAVTTDAPILCYTIDVTDLTLWEPDLYQAVAYAMAGHICGPLTGKTGKAGLFFDLANGFILAARANNANEMHRRMSQRPETLAARGYSYGVVAPYIYPYGSLFTSTGAPVV